MGMEYIRKTYGVPAKRGARVMPQTGCFVGRVCRITNAKDGLLWVTEVRPIHLQLRGLYHPQDLMYLPANTQANRTNPQG